MKVATTPTYGIDVTLGLTVEATESDAGAPLIAVTWRQFNGTHMMDLTPEEAVELRDALTASLPDGASDGCQCVSPNHPHDARPFVGETTDPCKACGMGWWECAEKPFTPCCGACRATDRRSHGR